MPPTKARINRDEGRVSSESQRRVKENGPQRELSSRGAGHAVASGFGLLTQRIFVKMGPTSHSLGTNACDLDSRPYNVVTNGNNTKRPVQSCGSPIPMPIIAVSVASRNGNLLSSCSYSLLTDLSCRRH